MDKEFWMVWSPAGNGPRVRHARLEDAEQEAERLADLHPGTPFIVLEAVGSVIKSPFTWTRYGREPVDDIPF